MDIQRLLSRLFGNLIDPSFLDQFNMLIKHFLLLLRTAILIRAIAREMRKSEEERERERERSEEKKERESREIGKCDE